MNPLRDVLRELLTTTTSTGILTCCPSPTLIRLGLGPTNPGTITVALETLLLRPTGFSPVLRLLIPAFSLDNAPPFLTKRLRRDINAPLPLHAKNKINIFGVGRRISPAVSLNNPWHPVWVIYNSGFTVFSR